MRKQGHMSELWIDHLSIEAWQEPGCWTDYFDQVQEILGSPLTHLDVNDPVKRKVASLEDAGNYVCAFNPREDSRWVLGKFKAIGIECSIEHRRQVKNLPNSLMWYVPLSFIEESENCTRFKALFDLGNRTFKPFYAYSDDVSYIKSKNKSSGAVDIQSELLGVFWMTYFNAAYVSFFGEEKFNDFPNIELGDDGGITVLLGDSPRCVSSELREQLVTALGNQSFVNPNEKFGKMPGSFALTFQQLLLSKK